MSSASAIRRLFRWVLNQVQTLDEKSFTIDKVLNYCHLEPEENETTAKVEVDGDWPLKGSIEYKNVTLSYDNEKNVLDNVSFKITDGQKIGIVGRTGAGKSSLVTVLFRLAKFSGQISIDGVDSNSIQLKKLRETVSIIPQDPILFSGSIRKNLDPFNDYSEVDLWRALKDTNMDTFVEKLDDKLDANISEKGGNISVGQKQLLCMARAILRQTKILVLDEATANVDHETDQLIQGTIRRKFKHCTVMTVAHRINTIIDFDRIMVMADGKLVEFDSPSSLMDKKGHFYKMAQKAGINSII